MGERALQTMVRRADFERVLQARAHARTPHFSLHLVAAAPAEPVVPELSTDLAPVRSESVDDKPGVCYGTVVPKRHARRSVTRSLLKRQIREALRRHAQRLPASALLVVRLRAPFERTQFPSAASDALRAAARVELDALLSRGLR